MQFRMYAKSVSQLHMRSTNVFGNIVSVNLLLDSTRVPTDQEFLKKSHALRTVPKAFSERKRLTIKLCPFEEIQSKFRYTEN